jgi:short-subunit dehydrogenase
MSATLTAAPAPTEPAALGIRPGERALVTGASSGIGEAFARTLAGRGVALLITGLPAEHERLDAIAAELSDRHGVRCEAVPMDLSAADGPDRLCAAADALGFEPDLLVNSAGIGTGGRFAAGALDTELRMIQVNVTALVALTGRYVPRMSQRGAGAVINIASTAAFQPLPYFSVYGASKAFVLSFGEALWAEGRRSGVRVVNVCSGPVETPFHGDGAAPPKDRTVRGFLRRRYLTTDRLIADALAAVVEGRPTVVLRMPVIGLLARPLGVLRAVLPPRARLLVSERMNRWYFGEA